MATEKSIISSIIWVKKPLFAGQQVASHTCFHIDGSSLYIHHLLYHAMGMVYPLAALK